MLLISDLVKLLDSYLDKESVANIYQAYLFGATAHQGQTRKTGEAYIYHPIAVAGILANMGCDSDTIVAAILHDVIEDTPVAKEQISHEFGEKVAHMVDGVSKLDLIQTKSKKQAQADNFRKMMLAMSSDVRVILIKIADRLHNMRTLYGMPLDKRKHISKETLDVYIPLAERLGMYEIKLELESLVLQHLYPWRYRTLAKTMRIIKKHANTRNSVIEEEIGDKLTDIGIEAKLLYREKSLFSVYHKMRNKRTNLADLDDIFALRIVVPNISNCYQALGVVHNSYKPVLGKFKDYIAIPKDNGYQSLHTVLFIQDGYNVEVQIRTKPMDEIAESGIASHWKYKTKGNFNTNDISQKWLQQVAELQRTAKNSEDFLENIKFDLFKNKVFVFSPEGKIFELPRGSTVLDFAYAVHTEIGDQCAGVTINGIKSHISTELKNGETVNIKTDKTTVPSPAWLDMVVSGKAISNIKHRLQSLERSEAVILGQKILNANLAKHQLSVGQITDWDQVLEKILHKDIRTMDEMYEAIAFGHCHSTLLVANILALYKKTKKQKRFTKFLQKIQELKQKKISVGISGAQNLVVKYASCCMPLPGDKIAGSIRPDNGLMVHITTCKNLQKQSDITELHWEDAITSTFLSVISLKLQDRTGALASVAVAISEANANISSVEAKKSSVLIELNLTNRQHLTNVISKLRKLSVVQQVKRV